MIGEFIQLIDQDQKSDKLLLIAGFSNMEKKTWFKVKNGLGMYYFLDLSLDQ